MEIKWFRIENLGGGTMAYFGEFEDGTFFSGNEEALNWLKKCDMHFYMGDVDYEEEEMQAFYKENMIHQFDPDTKTFKDVTWKIDF